MFKRILVPLDGSPLAEQVLPQVRTLAQCMRSEVVLLRVADRPLYNALFPTPSAAISLYDRAEWSAKHYLDALAAQLQQDGMSVSVEVCNGTVADAILEYTEAAQMDLIAMSTHGRSGVSRWLIGSVADRVVRSASVPVLLVHPTPSQISGASADVSPLRQTADR